MRLYRKIVALVTAFAAGISGVFLLSGAGVPALRILFLLFFAVCCLNLTLHFKEFSFWLRKTAQNAGAYVAASAEAKGDKKNGESAKSEDKPSSGGENKSAA